MSGAAGIGWRALAVAGITWLSATGNAVAQSAEPLPVDIVAAPGVVWIHRPVTLSGTSVPTGAQSAVILRITRSAAGGGPAPAPVVLNAPVDLTGHFSTVFADTLSAGLYQVHATAPDGNGAADTSFQVTDTASAAGEVDTLARAGTAVGRILTIIRHKIDLLPPSPARDEFVRDLGELDRRMLTVERATPGVVDEINAVLDAGAKVPLSPKLQADRDALLSALGHAAQAIARTPEQEQKMQQQALTCDNLEVVIEGLKYVSFLMNLIANPVGIAKNFGLDLAGYGVGKAAGAVGAGDAGTTAASTGSKNAGGVLMSLDHGKAGAFLQAENSATSVLNDALGFAASQVMNSYCEQFTGPVRAHMKAQFRQNGELWWEYSFDLRAKVTVHYPKDAAGGHVPLKGRIEGYAYNFKIWENAMTVLYPKLMSSAVTKKILIPPVDIGEGAAVIGNEYIEGSVAGSAAPNAFFFQVTGTAEEDRLVLQIGPARSDTDAKARIIALTLSPLSLAITFVSYSLPYKPVHFIFERTSGQYVIPLTKAGNVMRGKQHFGNEATRGGNTGTYSIDIEACNPGC